MTHNSRHLMQALCGAACLFAATLPAYADTPAAVTISLDSIGAPVSPSMYGVFFEEINHAGDGGLYAELVRNRSFEELEMPDGYHAEGCTLYPKPVRNHIDGQIKPEKYRWTDEPVPGWTLADTTSATMALTKDNPRFPSAPNSLRLTIADASTPASLINGGYWGMGVDEGHRYTLRTIIRTDPAYAGTATARILAHDGTTLAAAPLAIDTSGRWADITATLTPAATDSAACLALDFDSPGTLWLDYVSLFPERTFRMRPNGLRPDVAAMLENLRPAFVRWPGGCVVEGISLDNRFEWKKTLGDPAARPGEYSTWGYRCSYGFGYHEMLQFCEDIGAGAMYVCNVGLGCQFRMGDASPDADIPYYLDDCLDAIEYALGDSTTTWGALRAAAGHPEPFPLRYVEIGNENWGDEYDRRFDIFYDAIKQKYPELTLISNHGVWGTGKIHRTDMIDPHYYVEPEFFYANTTLFDNHPRGKYKVYVGEYACNREVGPGNMDAALAEAAFIGGMERNGDLVTMASYAPLFENRHDRSWSTNLIWIDTHRVLGRASYHVQQMAAANRPDYNVPNDFRPVPVATADTTLAPRRFVFSGYDRAAGELIIKVVNATDTPFPLAFNLRGASGVAPQATAITLAATALSEENTWEQPAKIAPRTATITGIAPRFDHTFDPCSYTILRIKTH